MARRLMLASVAAASITAAARPARADDDGPYRGTMAIVDVASVAVVASAIAGESAPGVMVGLAAYGWRKGHPQDHPPGGGSSWCRCWWARSRPSHSALR